METDKPFSLSKSSAEIYTKVMEIQSELGRVKDLIVGFDGQNGIRGDVRSMKSEVERSTSELSTHLKGLEVKINNLERMKNILVGIVAVLNVFVIPVVVAIAIKVFTQ